MRPTFITGWVTSDPTDPEAERVYATIRWDDSTERYALLSNPKDIDLGGPAQYQWCTESSVRRGLEAAVRRDKRHTAKSFSRFYGTMKELHFIPKKGKKAGHLQVAGRWQTFAAFVAYALTWSDKDYHGETQADREAEAALILSQSEADW